MLIETLWPYLLIACIACGEWALWRRRRRRCAENDAFMEWSSYPEPEPAPGGEPGSLGHSAEIDHDAVLAARSTAWSVSGSE